MALRVECGTTRLDSASHRGASCPTPPFPPHGVRNRHQAAFAESGRPHTGTLASYFPGFSHGMLTSIRVCLHANAVETAVADVTHCSPSAGKLRSSVWFVPLTHVDRQCTKAGVECIFYDHGRNEFLPRR
jgi:hypothetical protein